MLSGCYFIIITLYLLFCSSFNSGIILGLGFGAALLLAGAFADKMLKYTAHGFLKFLRYAAVILAAAVCGLAIFVCVIGHTDTATYKEDAVIVLGAAVRGETPSDALTRRLSRAAKYYGRNPEAIIVVSGGRGAGERVTEALAMERFLVSKGVPAEKIVREEKSTSTKENFEFSKEILDGLFSGRGYSAAYITNDFHAYRAGAYAEKCGIRAARCSSDTLWYTLHTNYLREILAIIKLWISG